MQKVGIVVEAFEGYAVVEVSRKSACEGCASASECDSCASLGGKREMRAKAENPVGAGVGDRVLIETASGRVIFYAAAVFIMPILLGILGFVIGGFISEAAQYIVSVLGFAGAFVFLYFGLNKSAERRNNELHFDIKIVRIVE